MTGGHHNNKSPRSKLVLLIKEKLMKKLLLLVTAIAVCSVSGVFAAGRYRCNGCPSKCEPRCERRCAPKCPKICETIVNEAPIPTQCCKRLIEVEDQPLLTKHVDITYECHCPQTCPIKGEVKYITEGKTSVNRTAEYKKINGSAEVGQ